MSRIYKRGKVWYLDYYDKGFRVQRRASQDKKTAERLLAELELKRDRGELTFLRNIPIDKYIEEYLEYSKANKTFSSYQRDTISLKKHLFPFLEHYNIRMLQRIGTAILEKYQIVRLKEVKPATINKEFTTIKHFFNKAIEKNYLKANPAKGIKAIKSQQKFPRYLSKEKIQTLLDTAQGDMEEILITFLNTGMRRGELTNLQWEDVHLKSRRITIQGQTKSKRPRFIPINDSLLEVLQKRLKSQNSPYVFPTRTGKPKDGHSLLRDIKLVYKKAGIEGNLHLLRHTFASHLIMSGVDLATVRELLGHSDIKTTMIYSHLAPEHLRGATEKLRF